MRICRRISTQCIIIVVIPTVSPLICPVTYGKLEIGEVPKFPLMEKPTPKAMISRPTIRKSHLFIDLILLFKLTLFLSCVFARR